MKQTPNAFILDVRTPEEALKERVIGCHHIPYYNLEKNIAKVQTDKPIFLYCRIGMRVRIASSILSRHGIESNILPIKFEELGEAGVPLMKNQPL